MNKTILALGADIKNRFLLSDGKDFIFGPELGDLSDAKNFGRLKAEISRAVKSFKANPDIIVCDSHPGYFSSRFAWELKSMLNIPCCHKVQHHHAHIASVIFEHDIKGPVIGVAFDGTGYGTDGNIWGGEFLLVKGGLFDRAGHLKYRQMPGSEKVVKEPWRMVLSILGEEGAEFLKGIDKKEISIVLSMLEQKVNSPLSSGAGRLFDAAAALLGICQRASFEAQGPIKLELLCDKDVPDKYDSEITEDDKGSYIVDTDGMFRAMAKEIRAKKPVRLVAAKFHNSVADIIVNTALRLSKKFGVKNIALSGGVFQNKYLAKKVFEKFFNSGVHAFVNEKYPVNDYNISLGQYYVSCNSGKN